MGAMTGTVRRVYDGIALSYGMTMVVLGSTIPSGLYSIYQRDWGLGSSSTVVFFSFYVVGVVIALLFGHVSDIVGRKPVILTCIALSLASSMTFTLATNFPGLCIGRTLSGLSVGLCTGAFTTFLMLAVSAATQIGMAFLPREPSLAAGMIILVAGLGSTAVPALAAGIVGGQPFVVATVCAIVAACAISNVFLLRSGKHR
ncbi:MULTISPECIES: MFS transporter [Corynebacterium]|uniref:MFS transporter n=1 Tax=Corynebacterium TaxID=1716 RepID=UPI001956FE59|nr:MULTISPECIES: MFS transporter [Corynebacterium]MDN8624294.1 MFS transporter [Corynebacterium kroppenstedtii]QRQ65411.1 MFS transporter [Corynebacterium kroppenstedtii]